MNYISNRDHSCHSALSGEYRKAECPFPKGILFHRYHLWDKEKYLTPYWLGNQKSKLSSNTSLQW